MFICNGSLRKTASTGFGGSRSVFKVEMCAKNENFGILFSSRSVMSLIVRPRLFSRTGAFAGTATAKVGHSQA